MKRKHKLTKADRKTLDKLAKRRENDWFFELFSGKGKR